MLRQFISMLTLSYMRIVFMKQCDVFLQVLGFVLMVLLLRYDIYDIGPFAMYVMAAVQLLSTLCWGLANNGKPSMKARRQLQRWFLILSPILLLSWALLPALAFMFSWFVMIWLGPVLGISYFITTIREIGFYRSLVHRDAI